MDRKLFTEVLLVERRHVTCVSQSMANEIEDQSKGDLAHVIFPALAAGSDVCFGFRLGLLLSVGV